MPIFWSHILLSFPIYFNLICLPYIVAAGKCVKVVSNGDTPFLDMWKHKSQAECCYLNFPSTELFNECMGNSSGIRGGVGTRVIIPCDLPPALSNEWYVQYDQNGGSACVQECDGGAPCAGRATNDKELYSTRAICCDNHLWWQEDCQFSSDDCSDSFWENYLTSSPERGYYPNCKSGQ